MSEYNVTIVSQSRSFPNTNVGIKVKHIRNYNGRQRLPNGGHTIIITCGFSLLPMVTKNPLGMMFTSKCRDNESFCRRVGLLNCLQRMLMNSVFKFYVGKEVVINDVSFHANGAVIYVAEKPVDTTYWWVGNTNRIGSKLYSNGGK